MKPEEVLQTAILPALELLPPKMNSMEAVVMMLAIGLQESRFAYRHQVGGPAHGFWQFENGGGVKGVMKHDSTRIAAMNLCRARGVEFEQQAVYDALETDDVLAAGFARLLLWTDPKVMPSITNKSGAWQLYARTWRPGKPHPETWPKLHAQAVQVATNGLVTA